MERDGEFQREGLTPNTHHSICRTMSGLTLSLATEGPLPMKSEVHGLMGTEKNQQSQSPHHCVSRSCCPLPQGPPGNRPDTGETGTHCPLFAFLRILYKGSKNPIHTLLRKI